MQLTIKALHKWQVLIAAIGMAAFVITNDVSGDLVFATLAPAFAAAIALNAAIPTTTFDAALVATYTALAAVIVSLVVILPMLTDPFAAVLIILLGALVAFMAVSAALEYAKKNDLTKKHVLLSVTAEFIAIATPMLYFVLK